MKTIEMSINGYKYYYAITRNNKQDTAPILFINGAFQNMKSWHQMNQYFSQWTSTIVLDLPGWGEADHLPGHIDFSMYAEAIINVLEREGIALVNLISTSYGTPIAVQFAKSFPTKVENLILTSPLMQINATLAREYSYMKKLVEQKDLLKLTAFLFDIGLMNSAEGECGNIKQYELISALFQKQIMRLSDEKLQKFMSNTDRIMSYGTSSIEGVEHLRTLIFTGQYDTFTSGEQSKALADRFMNAKVEVIPETDHLFLFEHPEFAMKLISDFLFVSRPAHVQILSDAIHA